MIFAITNKSKKIKQQNKQKDISLEAVLAIKMHHLCQTILKDKYILPINAKQLHWHFQEMSEIFFMASCFTRLPWYSSRKHESCQYHSFCANVFFFLEASMIASHPRRLKSFVIPLITSRYMSVVKALCDCLSRRLDSHY